MVCTYYIMFRVNNAKDGSVQGIEILVDKYSHAFARALLDKGDRLPAVDGYGFRVDEKDRCAGTGEAQQSGGGIHVERCSDDNEQVGLLHFKGRGVYHGDAFAEEHDERTEQGTVAR